MATSGGAQAHNYAHGTHLAAPDTFENREAVAVAVVAATALTSSGLQQNGHLGDLKLVRALTWTPFTHRQHMVFMQCTHTRMSWRPSSRQMGHSCVRRPSPSPA